MPQAAALETRHELDLRIARIAHAQAEAEALRLSFRPMGLEQPARLVLDIERLKMPALDQELRSVHLECEPSMQARPDAPELAEWACQGPVRWRGGQADWSLGWRSASDLSAIQVRLAQGSSELVLDLPLVGKRMVAQARRLSAGWMQRLLPQWQWQGGRIDGRLEHTAPSQWRGELKASALAAQTPDGRFALAGVALSGPFEIANRAHGQLSVAARSTLTAGEVLAGPFYVGWPEGSAVSLDLAMVGQGGRWQVDRLSLGEDGFSAAVSGRLDNSGSGGRVQAADIAIGIDLDRHYERYLGGVMTWLGQRDVSARGQLDVRVGLAENGRLTRLDAALEDVGLRHPAGRYDLVGVTGELGFRDDGDDEARTALGWRRLGVSGLPLEAGRLVAVSRGGELVAQSPVVLGLFGGSITLDALRIRPFDAEGDRLSAAVELRDIDMTSLATAFRWPAFPGRLDASLPRLRYSGERLTVDGELDIEAFDGSIDIGALAIERPFGVAPALSADVRMRGLDLQPMTEVFGFGRIEGRLDGDIVGLRLLDWRPVAFDADLRSQESGRRRISQLAVEQLTSVGGGGSVSGLQGRLLGAFDSFSYRRIGLSCRLANDVCEMGGIEGEDGSYTILQGSGLPQITIRGFQRRVDWPVLVGRLQAMLRGAAPTVE
jgi:hypothetical protein